MNSLVLAESSNTVNNQKKTAREYYQGQFSKVENLSQSLSEYSTVDLHIVSDRFGLIKGSNSIADSPTQTREQAISDVSRLLRTQVGNYDIIVILLTTDTFTEAVIPHWEEIVGATKPSSIWCIGVAKSALKKCDLAALGAKVANLIIYERVGVAPINNNTRNELLEVVEDNY